ncbi:hypothetical protein DPMN_185673 [Dreissena polymorpha]|uniref:Uncharacterized protein n=1 Tax=Dreissena polymorpha TaxID=45954 RepID=A0A9D4DK48_DREPO|nr:hypothetical protein DPMN_185673 [Dreissena polymorpha]
MPVEAWCVIRGLPEWTGAPPGTSGMNRGQPGLNLQTIKMFYISGMNRDVIGLLCHRGSTGTPPAFTGAPPERYRLGPKLDKGTTGYDRDSPDRHRDKT